jgi:hypothetical protein
MRQIVVCLPVVLSALVLGACAPPAESGNNGPIVPSGGGDGNVAGTPATTAGSNNMPGGGAGGMSTSGGAMTGGAAGNTPGGGAGGVSGGSGGGGGGGPSGPKATTGCGKDPGQALGQYVAHTVPIEGLTLDQPDNVHDSRQIHVRLPANYDPMTPYRVVYITVGCGGSGTSGYPLWEGDPNAIYVGLSRPEPPRPPSLDGCYENRGGVNSIEWESLEKDHYYVSERFCIDNNKVYTGGYSSGGWMSNMYSCYFAGIPDPPRKFLPDVAIRGVMANAGCFIPENPPCQQLPVGALWVHDESDMAPNAYSCAVQQRDRVLAQNGCEGGANGPTEVWGADFLPDDGDCLKYTNCPAAYPVIFCSTTGRGHGASNDYAIPGFTKMIQEMEAAAP